MNHNPTDRMQDPFYAGLIFQIESRICHADAHAKSENIALTDSQVRSAILKARRMALGATPKISGSNERERILAALIDNINRAPKSFRVQMESETGEPIEEPLPVSFWADALETVAESIETRRSDFPGSRDYLDFLHEFIERARSNSRSPHSGK